MRSGLDYLVALLIILSLNFLLPRLMPGNPLQAIYGEEALVAMTPELQAELVERFSLDRSTGEQFTAYITALARGDLGYSYYHQAPVVKTILQYLPWTLLLVGMAVLLSAALGVLLGVESGYRRGRPADRTMLALLMFTGGFPDFFLAILLLLLFGVTLGIAPLGGAMTPYAAKSGIALFLDLLHHLALPLCALTLSRISHTYLLTRNSLIATLGEPYILTARAKGCRESAVKYRHVARSAILPVITAAGLQLSFLFTGSLFIEIVFSYPGVGTLLYEALLSRDYPLMQGVLLMVTVMVLAVNFLLERIYRRIDPRIQGSG